MQQFFNTQIKNGKLICSCNGKNLKFYEQSKKERIRENR